MNILIASRYVEPFPQSSNRNVYLQAQALKNIFGFNCQILTWPSNDQWTGHRSSTQPSPLIRQDREGMTYWIFNAPIEWDAIAGGNIISDSDWQDAIRYAKKILKQLAPDIVHLHHRHGLWWILEAAQDLNIPTIYTNHDWGIPCLRTTLVQGDGNLCDGICEIQKCARCIEDGRKSLLARINERLVKYEFFASLIRLFKSIPYFKYYLYRRQVVDQSSVKRVATNLERANRALSNLHHCIVPSQFAKRFFLEAGCKGSQITILPWYASPIKETRRLPSTDRLPPTITYVGRISPEKGLDWILSCLEFDTKLHPINIRIAGAIDSPFAHQLFKKYPAFCGRHSLSWLGWASESQIYDSTHAILLPSLWMDNTPLTLIEAFANKIPVIASDIPTFREFINVNENGFLFTMYDQASFIKCLIDFTSYADIYDQKSEPKIFPSIDSLDQYAEKVAKIYINTLA